MRFWISAVAPSPARIAARSFRVLLAPLTYIRVGDAAPTIRFFAMIGYTTIHQLSNIYPSRIYPHFPCLATHRLRDDLPPGLGEDL